MQLLNLVSAKCRGREEEEGEGRAQRLDEDLILQPSEVVDVVLCIGDLAATLSTFAEVYPPACKEMGNTGLLERWGDYSERHLCALILELLEVNDVCLSCSGL